MSEIRWRNTKKSKHALKNKQKRKQANRQRKRQEYFILAQEIVKELALDLPPTITVSPTLPSNSSAYPCSSHFLLFSTTITPSRGFYKGASFEFEISFPPKQHSKDQTGSHSSSADPMNTCPLVTCVDDIYHPNISEHGEVGLEVLHRWKPGVYRLDLLILALACILDQPNVPVPPEEKDEKLRTSHLFRSDAYERFEQEVSYDIVLNREAALTWRFDREEFARNVILSLCGGIVDNIQYHRNTGPSYATPEAIKVRKEMAPIRIFLRRQLREDKAVLLSYVQNYYSHPDTSHLPARDKSLYPLYRSLITTRLAISPTEAFRVWPLLSLVLDYLGTKELPPPAEDPEEFLSDPVFLSSILSKKKALGLPSILDDDDDDPLFCEHGNVITKYQGLLGKILEDDDTYKWIGDKQLGIDLSGFPRHMKCPYCDH